MWPFVTSFFYLAWCFQASPIFYQYTISFWLSNISLLWIYHILFIHSSGDEPLGGLVSIFWLIWIMLLWAFAHVSLYGMRIPLLSSDFTHNFYKTWRGHGIQHSYMTMWQYQYLILLHYSEKPRWYSKPGHKQIFFLLSWEGDSRIQSDLRERCLASLCFSFIICKMSMFIIWNSKEAKTRYCLWTFVINCEELCEFEAF